jgi:hypothetical protein
MADFGAPHGRAPVSSCCISSFHFAFFNLTGRYSLPLKLIHVLSLEWILGCTMQRAGSMLFSDVPLDVTGDNSYESTENT